MQTSVARRACHKLAFKYYGPFQVIGRVGKVAYRLQLPEDCRIHPVIHVSQLRLATGFTPSVQTELPPEFGYWRVLVQFLDRRLAKKGNSVIEQVLTQWTGSPAEDSTWEDKEELRQRFPRALAWGQASFQGREDVSSQEGAPQDEGGAAVQDGVPQGEQEKGVQDGAVEQESEAQDQQTGREADPGGEEEKQSKGGVQDGANIKEKRIRKVNTRYLGP